MDLTQLFEMDLIHHKYNDGQCIVCGTYIEEAEDVPCFPERARANTAIGIPFQRKRREEELGWDLFP